jgi:hypothetical protein
MAASLTASGIAMPATQSAVADANTIDDYEEGTWTPTAAAGNSGTPTYSSQVGLYNKIGRLVYLTMDLRMAGGGTGTASDFQVGGCPFTTNSNTNYWHAGAVLCRAGNSLVQTAQVFIMLHNEARIHIWRQNTTGYNGVTGAQIGASGQFLGSISHTI